MMAVLTANKSIIGDRIIKVNHAGEHGAICIYTAQIIIARITAPSMIAELREFRQHERQHRAIFQDELQRRALQRCRSYWLCAAGGFILGSLTAILGKRAIAATTATIEDVVLHHLEHQLTVLHDDPDAAKAIAKIIADERQHHDQSAAHLRNGDVWMVLLHPVVAASTELVIWLGMHL
jgi:ubiquinone biosynthesis monooxygenase Coq7